MAGLDIKGLSTSVSSILSSNRAQLIAGVILTLLVMLPMWMLPIAPLPDWVTHLALSHEAYLLFTHQIAHPFYFLDFSFLGYSFMYFVLVFLQMFLPWELAGKITLSLLVAVTPICWWYFLKVLAPGKEPLFIAGFLLIYSWFFYGGMISFLFSVNFGLVFLAVGITEQTTKRGILKFLAIGLLTFTAHVYTFFLCVGLIFIVQLYRLFFQRRLLAQTTLLPCIALLIPLLVDSLASYTAPARDIGFYQEVLRCTSSFSIDALKNSTANPAMGAIFSSGLNLVSFAFVFKTVYFFEPLFLCALLGAIGFLAYLLFHTLMDETAPDLFHILPSLHFEHLFLFLAFLLFLHPLVISEYQVMETYALLPFRSIPFFIAFVLIAVRFKRAVPILFCAIALLVLANVMYMTAQFNEHRAVQETILPKVARLAQSIPPNSTVFVVPGEWDLPNSSKRGVFANPYYHSVLLLENPTIYVSNEFFNPPPSFLHSRFPIFDELKWDNRMNSSAVRCYESPPKDFNWVVDADMSLRKNR